MRFSSGTHQVAIAAGDQAIGEFDDTDLGAERVVNTRHFQADDAAADDEHALGQVEFECASGIDDARIVGQAGQAHRFGTGGDDAVLERNLARALARCDLALVSTVDPESIGVGDREFVRRNKLADAANHFDFALFRQHAEAAGEAADDFVLPRAQLREIDFRLAELEAGAAIASASSITFAACNSALEGMQPTLRQTPPSCGQRSIKATFMPRSAARKAAV